MVHICREFGWDYFTYMLQPTWFIDLIVEKMNIDSVHAEAEAKRMKRQ